MKRDKQETKKDKGFAATPFKALKGLKVEPQDAESASPSVPKKPEPVKEKLSADDADLFFQAMADVRKLKGEQPSAKPKKEQQQLQPKEELFNEEDRRLFLETITRLRMDKTFADGVPDEEKKMAAPGKMRQLKRGTIRIDFELDLHGLTRDEALVELERFISGAYRRGQQAVLVITGKGNNSPGEPVLQSAVSSWLREKGKVMVAEFAPAPRELGGAGAFVVFMRKPPVPSESQPSG